MKSCILIVCLVLCLKTTAQLPNVFIMNADRLADVKKKVQQKDKATLQLIDSLKKQADGLLSMKPVSVMDKEFTPVSGNKHDYMSQAPYFWYDSTKPNGLPYKRKDGERNPEIYKITDRTYLGKLDDACRVLSLAWYFTGEEKYADKATALIRTWFIDEATKMNPHLEYGQAVPGVNTGRGIGIIETVSLTGIVDAIGLLTGSRSWKNSEHQALQQWFSQYLNWLLTSKNGTDEHKAKNNHGTWYYAQVIDFALFTGDKIKALELAKESKARLDSQLTKEGQQPLELERTNSLGYSTMNLRGWFSVATLAEKTGVDIWNFQTSRDASLRTAFDWLIPYAMGKKAWTWDQISKYNKSEIYPLLLWAAEKYKDPNYLTKANEIKEGNNTVNNLLYKK